ncbi:fibrinogen-like protein 1-like protein [Heterodontus francisci]|uniref:fibrinogen-like protein 1-like protein n=1 Tax=Heterodontus francisci TaxID=7792 RepID=UPI00355ADD4D
MKMMKMEQGTLFQISFFLLLIMATISAVPHDCTEIQRKNKNAISGLYVIKPEQSPPLVVNCVMRSNGSWTVIQRNSKYSKITWTESWTTYKYGFGDVLNDHWLGNEYIHLLTRQARYKLRIEFTDNKNKIKYAEYSSFYLEHENDKYTIRLGHFSGGVVTNTITDNQKFTTKDKDNDNYQRCCATSRGGWWYDACGSVYLNYKYPYWSGLTIQKVTMMIQPTC